MSEMNHEGVDRNSITRETHGPQVPEEAGIEQQIHHITEPIALGETSNTGEALSSAPPMQQPLSNDLSIPSIKKINPNSTMPQLTDRERIRTG